MFAASLRFSSLSSKNTLDCMYFKSLYPLALTTTITRRLAPLLFLIL
nr:MAG TPA: hypothetical protein [Caudoviricetes sp.]